MFKTIKIFIFSFIFFFLPLVLKASTLYMDPAASQYGPGDSFPIDVKINTDGQCVNTVEINIGFTKGYLQVVDFIFGDSIINLWVDQPDVKEIDDINSSGQIYLAGGTPGGYCGKIPGDPGDSNTIARIIFKVPSMFVSDNKLDTADIKFLDITKAFLNDGFGTLDSLTVKNAVVKILNAPAGAKPDWQEQIKNDKIQPEPFIIELHSYPNVYDGEYYIDFFTTDKQSGVDYYEVLEKRPDEEIGRKTKRSILDFLLAYKKEPLNWRRGEIPYLLEDQSLKSIISVKAVDKAGNERLAEFVPPKSEQEKVQKISNKYYLKLSLIVFGCLVLLAVIVLAAVLFIRKRKPKSSTQIDSNQEKINRDKN